MAIKKISEQTFVGQLMTVLSMSGLMVGLLGGVVLMAADKAIDETYATDADVRAVQEQVDHKFDNITEKINNLSTSVEANTDVSRETSSSVKNLALTLITMQIRDLEPTIRELEQEKKLQGNQWSRAEDRTLRDMQRSLRDLESQRQRLFAIISGE